jgi:predicted Zn-ribbon and HTH transcriptional regulator
MIKRKRDKEPPVPAERHETIRQEIMEVLEGRTLSAKEISGLVGVSAREAYEHLEHIHRSAEKKDFRFTVIPAECKKCGFVFRKREKLKKPGKCPVCRGESIQEPLFSIKKSGPLQ